MKHVACPCCGKPIECPHCHGEPARGADPSDARLLSCGARDVAIAHDDRLGFLLVGVFAPEDGGHAALRAVDAAAKRVVWEALAGEEWLRGVGANDLAVGESRVYVAHQGARALVALDLRTGAVTWRADLSGEVATIDPRGAAVVETVRDGRALAIVATRDDEGTGLASIDAATGETLWWRRTLRKAAKLQVVKAAGDGLVFVRPESAWSAIEIVDATRVEPIAPGAGEAFTDFQSLAAAGRFAVCHVDMWRGARGDETSLGKKGIVVAGEQFAGFFEAENLDSRVAPATMDDRIFASAASGASIASLREGKWTRVDSPVAGHDVVALHASARTLLALLVKKAGAPKRRLVGLDPDTLAVRFDAGTELGAEPRGAPNSRFGFLDDTLPYDRHVAVDGTRAFVVASPDDDRQRCDLRAIDAATGATLWSAPVGTWCGHALVAGHVVHAGERTIDVLRAEDGKCVVRYVAER